MNLFLNDNILCKENIQVNLLSSNISMELNSYVYLLRLKFLNNWACILFERLIMTNKNLTLYIGCFFKYK